ncbi:MAG: hypothetical protein WAM60_24705 [Candidatus Promineifilaceae bacterium]
MLKNKSKLFLLALITLTVLGSVAQDYIILVNRTGPLTANDIAQLLGWGLALPLIFSIVGLMIVNKQPSNRVGWLMVFVAFFASVPLSAFLDAITPPPTILTPALFFFLWVDGWSWMPLIFSIFLIPLYFPTGTLPTSRWRWITRLALGLFILFCFITPFVDPVGPTSAAWGPFPNPVGFISIDFINGPFLLLWGIGLMTIVLGSVSSLFVRFRRAKATERQQIKWLVYAGAIFAAVYGLSFFLIDPESTSGWNSGILVLAILSLPIAIAISILRYQLYDIDVIIRRTVTYAILTALLGLVYFGTVVLLQAMVGRATEEQSPLVIVFSTLLIAALFSPLRRRIQAFIDRRFYRRKYDAAQALARFAANVRDETDLAALQIDLKQVLDETMLPTQISFWIRE